MQIERISVQEGFLDGLELELSPGLNVIIGARGTGKSSVLQLLRYCLGLPSFTEDGTLLGDEHARAVLGSGRVKVVLSHAGLALDRAVLQRALHDAADERTERV